MRAAFLLLVLLLVCGSVQGGWPWCGPRLIIEPPDFFLPITLPNATEGQPCEPHYPFQCGNVTFLNETTSQAHEYG